MNLYVERACIYGDRIEFANLINRKYWNDYNLAKQLHLLCLMRPMYKNVFSIYTNPKRKKISLSANELVH